MITGGPASVFGTGTSTTIPGLAAGTTYTFTVTNAAGCTSLASANVVINAAPVPPSAPLVGTITQPDCTVATGSVVLNGLPGGSWTINPGNIPGSGSTTTIPGLAPGDYTFTVSNGTCASAPSINVHINAAPAVPAAPTVGTITHPTCTTATGSVVLNNLPSSGIWVITGGPASAIGAGTSTTISGLAAGTTYTFTVTNSGGCTSVASAPVVINAAPAPPSAPTVGTITQPTCIVTTGSVVLNGLPAGNWTINPGNIPGNTSSTTVSGLATGTYNFIVTTAAGCISAPSGNVVINAVPAPPLVFNVTGGGSFCNGVGVPVLLSGSQIGVNYVLIRDIFTSVGTIPGTGLALDFGNQATTGVYTVRAINPLTGCESNMTGSATVMAGLAPLAFNVTGGGNYCGGAGVQVGLAASQTGFNYQLIRDGGTLVGLPMPGNNGFAIDFGYQTAGVYTVIAINATTLCQYNMNGSTTVTGGILPATFTVTGGGYYCTGGPGVAVGLSDSETGVNYQLMNGATPVGSAVAGTGNAISFGNLSVGGTFTVIATNAITGCQSNMIGNAIITVGAPPTVFNVTGGGNYCGATGVEIYLSGSQTGVNYQLMLGASTVGGPLAGTNGQLDFGYHTVNGTYTVVATNAITTCTSNMTGSATITGGPNPAVFNVTGGGSYCGVVGVPVGLSGSQTGVNYQLKIGGVNTGSPVAGTGSAISFGNQTTNGICTVEATNATTGCAINMNGSVTISGGPSPTAFNVTGGGLYCSGPGYVISLSGSQSGVNYQLKRGAMNVGSPIAGTGSALNFPAQTILGTYTVVGTNGQPCSATMNGSAILSAGVLPDLYTVTVSGTGFTCNSSVHLSGSQVGVNYQLKRAGSTNVGSPVAGTGNPINFGPQTIQAYYSVVATTQFGGCNRTMTGSPPIMDAHPPTAYNVIGGGAACSGPGVSVGLAGSQSGVSYQLREMVHR